MLVRRSNMTQNLMPPTHVTHRHVISLFSSIKHLSRLTSGSEAAGTVCRLNAQQTRSKQSRKIRISHKAAAFGKLHSLSMDIAPGLMS